MNESKTYLWHLFDLKRLSAGLWVFLGGTLATMLVYFSTTNVMTLTWFDLKAALVTALITQVTKAWTNYMDGKNVQATQLY